MRLGLRKPMCSRTKELSFIPLAIFVKYPLFHPTVVSKIPPFWSRLVFIELNGKDDATKLQPSHYSGLTLSHRDMNRIYPYPLGG